MPLSSLLIANRGEVAIRIARTAGEMGLRTVAVHAEDDAASLHVRKADDVRPLKGIGAAAYLDAAQLVAVAKEAGCDAVHPGYGFLSENAGFARACAEAGLVFVGPKPRTLDLFGDKARARALAERHGVPVLPGTAGATSLEDARAFLEALGPDGAVMVKAIAGGGGRGMRPVRALAELDAAYARCASEAKAAFGNGDLYVERLISRARHIEVQVVADAGGAVGHLWERECSIQRQRQKLVEIAPAPGLHPTVRDRLLRAAVGLAEAASYENIGTFEFLVDADGRGGDAHFFFIEANPRLQVEHTVTEEVTGVDLVRTQLEIAAGRSLADLGLAAGAAPRPRGTAVQVRINMESMAKDGSPRPSGGTLAVYEMPSGPGVRVDGFGYAGYRTSPRYDSLLAKLIVHAGGGFEAAAAKAYRALCEARIAGLNTNIPFLQALLRHPEVLAGRAHTRFVEEHIADLAAAAQGEHRRLFFEGPAPTPPAPAPAVPLPASAPEARVGARLDSTDPLAILVHGKRTPAGTTTPADAPATGPAGTVPLAAPMQGTIISVAVKPGDAVRRGQQVLILEAMKMEHVIEASADGAVRAITVAAGDTVSEGHPLAHIEPGEVAGGFETAAEEVDLDAIRPDLAEMRERRGLTLDEGRPDAVARRRKTGQRTARENVDDLCDPGSYLEYGAFVTAARRQRMSMDELIRRTPADGLVAGIGRVNGDRFPDEASRCMVISYDYTVLAGTQGKRNHQKKDRMFALAERQRLPLIFLTEGGGGRPGDTDVVFAANLHTEAFWLLGKLSGLVPMVGIASGRCFAGNAVILGCCDVIIATEDSTIGMGGPAMIEGGGLGVFAPEEVGPISVQARNGVVDIPVKDEAEACAKAKQYLSYMQGAVADWTCPDQRLLRRVIPENRLRVYDVHRVIELLADDGSMLEIRPHFGLPLVTAFIRIEGRPVGVIANNPMHLGGAIDSDSADKAARLMQICDAFDIPMLSLCDTPGNMVGPEAEKTALVRHCARLFVIGANLTVPFMCVVLRKGYGLGAQAMAGGSFHAPLFCVSWPQGEFGGMGLEGAVKLGYRDELAAIEDPAARRARYEERVAAMYAQGKALNAASLFELDDVIDPVDTRRWIAGALRSAPPVVRPEGKKRPWVDAW